MYKCYTNTHTQYLLFRTVYDHQVCFSVSAGLSALFPGTRLTGEVVTGKTKHPPSRMTSFLCNTQQKTNIKEVSNLLMHISDPFEAHVGNYDISWQAKDIYHQKSTYTWVLEWEFKKTHKKKTTVFHEYKCFASVDRLHVQTHACDFIYTHESWFFCDQGDSFFFLTFW